MKRKLAIYLATLVSLVLLESKSYAGVAKEPSSKLYTVNPETPQGLQALFAPDGDALPMVSAHRGGAGKGLPENCIETFERTLRATWSMLEVDLRRTKDGTLVLNHDATLDRTTNGSGLVLDHTLEEIRRLRLKDREGKLTSFGIPTLAETLKWARGKAILVLDKKDVPVQDVVRAIGAHRAEAYAMVMAYSFADIKECYALNRDVMMEIMIGNDKRFEAFDSSGVPWGNVIAFVGHSPPRDAALCARIYARGARCMAGTSRNIDRLFLDGQVTGIDALETRYRALLALGVDVIETDVPREVGPLLYEGQPIPSSKVRFFQRPSH